jgi:hypothetical protein
MSRYLYLVRHGEQVDAEFGLPEGPLSDKGSAASSASGQTPARCSLRCCLHFPLQRAVETAEVITTELGREAATPSALLMDCVPGGVTPDMPSAFEGFFGGVSPEELAAGEAQMSDAIASGLPAPVRTDTNSDYPQFCDRVVCARSPRRGSLALDWTQPSERRSHHHPSSNCETPGVDYAQRRRAPAARIAHRSSPRPRHLGVLIPPRPPNMEAWSLRPPGERVDALTERIRALQDAYYRRDEVLVSDADYDALVRRA